MLNSKDVGKWICHQSLWLPIFFWAYKEKAMMIIVFPIKRKLVKAINYWEHICISQFKLPQKNNTDWGGLHIRNLLLTVLQAGKSKIRVLVNVVSGKNALAGLWTVAFLLCPHMAKRVISGVSSSYKGINTVGWMKAPPYDLL